MNMSVICYSFRTYVKDMCGRALNEQR